MRCKIACSLFAACLMSIATHAQTSRFFWTTSDAIGSAWGDGSHVTYILTGLKLPTAIAVDSLTIPPMIYFSENGSGRILKARYDGTDTSEVVTGLKGVTDIELDIWDRKIYWIQDSWNDDRIQRAAMDWWNTGVEDIYTSTSTGYDFSGLALDSRHQVLFWSQSNNGGYDKICRINTNKTGYQILFDLYTGMSYNPADIDVMGDHIYWTDPYPSNSYVWYADEDGTNADTVLGVHTHYFVIDSVHQYIYWTQSGGIGRAHLDGRDSTLYISGLTPGISSIAYCPGNIPAVGVKPDEFVPRTCALEQNYPNPFNPTTVISYKLSVVSSVKLVVYDILGREVETLVNEPEQPGSYVVRFDGSRLAGGTYFLRLQAGSFVSTIKMVLVK